ncbi:MAG: 4Fe-4S single cluster domain-containing protein [Pseudonocardiaceae bacterium]
MRVARIVHGTDGEGPGRRTAVWVQGCTIRCPGCFNPHLWASGGPITDTDRFADETLHRAVGAGAQGITLLGGEPFEQAAPLARVAEHFRDAGLSVMTFTGYTLFCLTRWASQRVDIAALLAATDLLADGPYLAERPERRRPWIGSTNQCLHDLSGRYSELLTSVTALPDRIEVRVEVDGTIAVNGWADADTLDAFLAGLGRRADRPTASLRIRSEAVDHGAERA